MLHSLLHGRKRALLGRRARLTVIAALFAAGQQGFHGETYDPNTLLARRNGLTYSEQFDNAIWTKTTGVTVTPNTHLAPDGTVSADTLDSSAGNQLTSPTVVAAIGAAYTSSQHFLKTSGSTYTPSLYLVVGSTIYAARINTDTGVATAISAGGFTAPMAVSASDEGLFWRLQVTGVNLNGSTADQRVYPNMNASGGVAAGSQVIWGAQLEKGAAASAYQKVTDWNTEYMAAAAALVKQWTDNARTVPMTAVEQTLGGWDDRSGRGNHATQATANSRPKLSARVSLLTQTTTLGSDWSKGNVGSTSPSVTTGIADDSGGTSACRVGFGATVGGADYSRIAFLMAPTASGSYKRRAKVRASTGADIGKTLHCYVTDGAGVVGLQSVVLTAAWQLVESFSTLTAGVGRQFAFGNLSTDNGGVVQGAFSADICDPDCRTAADAALNIPAYQRVNTAADYDTVGFKHFPLYDGSDDYLAAASGGGGSAGFLFCAAVTPTGGAGTSRVLWSDRGTNTGYRVMLNTSNQVEMSAGNGTAYTSVATAGALPVGETHIVTAWDDGTNLCVQIDNGTVATVARPVVVGGTAGWTQCRTNGASSGYFPGRLPDVTYRQSDCGDAQRAQLKQYHADLAGYTLV